jgi:hypothetical protein
VLVAGDPDGDAVITSLTTDQSDDDPQGLAQRIFWSVAGVGGGVFQDNAIGGNTVTLSTSSAAARTNVVVHQAGVFWFSQNPASAAQPVFRGQVNVAASQVLVGTIDGPHIQSILIDPVNQKVLGSYASGATNLGTFQCPAAGGTCTTLGAGYSGQPGGNIATDGTNIYFADPDNGLILRTTLNGGSSGSYATAQATPNLIRVHGDSVYWSNSGTKTIQRSTTGSAQTPKQMASTPSAADALAADAVNVYWTESATGTLAYAPITGAGPNTPYVTLGPSAVPMRLARDTAFLYFSHKGAIYRVAVP